MDIAALLAWIATAAGGIFLFSTWFLKGGVPQQETGTTRFSAPLIFGHPTAAVAGLLVWIAYLATDEEALAWIAVGLLVLIAALGFTMFARWLAERGKHLGAEPTDVPAEQSLPLLVVVGHGAFAVTTVVLVLLAAMDAGS